MFRQSLALAVGAALLASACGARSDASSATTAAPDPTTTSTSTTSTTSTTAAPTTTTTTTPPTPTSTSTTATTTKVAATTTTTAATTTTTTTTTAVPVGAADDPPLLLWANLAFDDLAHANPAATMTVVRDGVPILGRAAGTTIDGAPATSDSPMVVASVSKLLTALMIARLAEAGVLDLNAPMPWSDLGIATDPRWADVTVRELLDHTSGMPVVRHSWFDGEVDCASFLPTLLTQSPTPTRGRWTYSNGNYCALGLLVEHLTWLPLDQAAQSILFDPLGLTGAHLTTGGQLPGDVGYSLGVARLSRLGGAGTFIVSTDDVAAVLAGVTPADLDAIRWPGLFVDQYGWGHTGSVDGAIACAWVLEGGRTVIAATVAGRSPATGGDVCDRVVPALAADLDLHQGLPDRSPP